MLRKLLLLTVIAAALTGAAFAQDDEVATGLNNPRHIFLAEDGALYIAEAGMGGEDDVTGPFGPAKAGLTAQVSAIAADGEASVVIPELVSMDAGFGQIEGVMGLVVTEDSYWVLLGMGPAEMTYEDKMVEALVQIDRESGEVIQSIDIRAFEVDNNPDDAEELVSNPADIAVDADGTVYIADASGNALYTWTEADGLALFASWSGADGAEQAVPTSVALGADGEVYVGFLSGFPFLPESARIERYSADGELEFTYPGLTLVTDLIVTEDGNLYAVEMASGFGDTGYIPESGRIVSVTEEGITPLFGGLNFPYGFALEADGAFLVTVDSAFGAPDSGRVIRISGELGS
ncbi:MAG: ScyD/ScyE family protein [Chloroflexota bacterium]|nr:ScyD/ScyE family protein [Chloroflexota bacterium]